MSGTSQPSPVFDTQESMLTDPETKMPLMQGTRTHSTQLKRTVCTKLPAIESHFSNR